MRGINIAGPCPECEEWCLVFARRCPDCGLTWPRLRPGWGFAFLILGLVVFASIALAAWAAKGCG